MQMIVQGVMELGMYCICQGTVSSHSLVAVVMTDFFSSQGRS